MYLRLPNRARLQLSCQGSEHLVGEVLSSVIWRSLESGPNRFLDLFANYITEIQISFGMPEGLLYVFHLVQLKHLSAAYSTQRYFT